MKESHRMLIEYQERHIKDEENIRLYIEGLEGEKE
jgi:hypothetical protein